MSTRVIGFGLLIIGAVESFAQAPLLSDGFEYPPGGPTPTLPSVQNSPPFVLDPSLIGVPTDGGGDPVDNTDRLQQAMDEALAAGHDRIRLPAGTYSVGKYGNEIYQAGLRLRSNMTFELAAGATIRMAPNNKWNYCVLDLDNVRDVTIRGGTLAGDRDGHVYTPRSDGATAHDEGHLICIEGDSQRVLVEDMLLRDATGDGILMVGRGNQAPTIRHVTVRDSEFDNNRRQGISLVGAQHVLIENNEIHDINGTPPQFGVDIEGGAIRQNIDIIIRANLFYANGTKDPSAQLGGGHIVNSDGRNVLIENNLMEQRGVGRGTDGSIVYWKNTDQTIRNNTIKVTDLTVNLKVGIINYSHSGPKTNPAATYIHDNICDGCGFYMYQNADLDIRRNRLIDGYLAFRDFSNLTLIDNEVDSTINACWAFRFRDVLGRASGNTYFGEPFELPLSLITPFEYCWQ